MSKDLLDNRALIAQLTLASDSISRAGRNCAVGMRPAASPRSEPGVAASSASFGGQRSARGGVPDLGVSGADDHKLAFGRGITADDGNRHELCSSPRPHPLMDAYRIAEFEAGRKVVFEAIRDSIPTLELVDHGAVEEEAALRAPLPHLKPSALTAAGDVTTLPESAVVRSPLDSALSARQPHSPVSEQQHHHPGGSLTARTTKHGAAAAATVIPSPPKAGGATPRQKRAVVPSASFTSPKRFVEPSMRFRLPPVGHYRPKFKAVEQSVVGGKMAPSETTTSRVPRIPLEKIPVPPLATVLKSARDELRVRPPGSPNGGAATPGHDDMASDDGLSARRPKNAIPEPTRHNSPVFRSKVPNCTGIKYSSAAADALYNTHNDTAHMSVSAAHVDFSRQTPRPGPPLNVMSPSHGFCPSSFSPETADRAPSIGKFSPRPPIVNTKWPPQHSVVDVTKADAHTRQRVPAIEFVPLPSGRNKTPPRVGVSCEEAAVITDPSLRRVASPDLRRMAPRADAKPAVNLPPLELNYELTDHRLRVATIRGGDGHDGHGSIFSGNGNMSTDLASVDVKIDAVRPNHLRKFDMSKSLERKEIKANIADLVYDYTPVSPRVTGNPMISNQVSRAKREQVLGQVSGPADVLYDVKPPGPSYATGMMDFSRQVDRYSHAQGYGRPSAKAADRMLQERESARAAAAQLSVAA